jgi:hypothetical protein
MQLYDWAYLPCGAPTVRGFKQGLLISPQIETPEEFPSISSCPQWYNTSRTGAGGGHASDHRDLL